MKYDRAVTIDTNTEPAIKVAVKNLMSCSLLAVFVIIKKKRIVKSSGINEINESALFIAKMLDKRAATTKSSRGKSKGVRLSLTLPKSAALIPSIRIPAITTRAIPACFGITYASVVMLETKRGNKSKYIPWINTKIVSSLKANLGLFSIIILI